MADRMKVIYGLEACSGKVTDCNTCPYRAEYAHTGVMWLMKERIRKALGIKSLTYLTKQEKAIVAPTVDAEPVRHGYIVIKAINPYDGEDCYCSECGHWSLLPDYKWCPYCGAKIEGETDEGKL